jgi:hypothetical protein
MGVTYSSAGEYGNSLATAQDKLECLGSPAKGPEAAVLIIAIGIQVAAGPRVPTVESIATPVAITRIGEGTAIAIAATIAIAAETGVALSKPPATMS